MATVAALAGRRIDSPSEPSRFPLESVALVAERLRTTLKAEGTTMLVCSAACGADLVALDVAAALKIARRIVLPFAVDRFRQESVADRPGDWGPMFDRIVAELSATGEVVVMNETPGTAGYAAASIKILDEAERLAVASKARVVSIVVWEGQPRPGTDLTDEFRKASRSRDIDVIDVLTR